MKTLMAMTIAVLAGLATRDTAETATTSPLAGAWALVAADRILPDGRQVRDYGEAPKGLLIVDARGRYSLQLFAAERLRFAGGNKAEGSADEFRSAALGSSTHYGTLSIDDRDGVLVFAIDAASFPNWDGTTQRRAYRLDGDTLSYRVPARTDGSIPLSVWRRIDAGASPAALSP